ncbi:ThiF family adenylyltransferase [Algoriphagus sp. Y33]|uniref:ThiF family adenylyltransferase n=1 Tax=Algoriphagus sp. Y33 TaxID=2772483 RepID=UPI0017843DBE|nr:ThiF family adenylyltransferase [Algoriphagus sp. Y33]
MSQQLINRNPDLKRLRDEGYEMKIIGGHLLVHHIPYLNSKKEIKYGTLVSPLTLIGNGKIEKPNNHVIEFAGENPCNVDGTVISEIQHSNNPKKLNDRIQIDRSFSNKPSGGYPNQYEKVKRYADIISAPAKFLDGRVTEKTFKVIADSACETVFQYIDTNSSRAQIENINDKVKGHKIAIVGLGGTGAYILDLVAKTPVGEIHIYDGDSFDQHNAFRSPGAASLDILNQSPSKVSYYSGIYSEMHKGILEHEAYVMKGNLSELDEMSYVFICVDNNAARKMITNYLTEKGIAFSDVGIGIMEVEGKLTGAVRVTSGSSGKSDHLNSRIFSEETEENEYATNIQIADLNALNGILAVIRWKKVSGIYVDLENEHHSTYSIEVSKIINDDHAA